MKGQEFVQMFGYNGYVIGRATGGITHEESLVHPAGDGNCMNWVLGHIAVYRNRALVDLGLKPTLDSSAESLYRKESQPIKDGSKAVAFEDLVVAVNAAQERLVDKFKEITDADLAAEKKDQRLDARLAFMQFHEAYHAGQLGILRRMLGKDPVIQR